MATETTTTYAYRHAQLLGILEQWVERQELGRSMTDYLTVAEVRAKSFRVWIIPHTRKVTALKERRVGDRVNLEADLLGKYAEKFLK